MGDFSQEFWDDVKLAIDLFVDAHEGKQRPYRVIVSATDKPDWATDWSPDGRDCVRIRQMRYFPSPERLETLKEAGHRTHTVYESVLGERECVAITLRAMPIRAGSFFIY